MDGLSLDQITVFLAIADKGSFSAAARDLRRAQSAVTYTINKLEDQIGTKLFDRSDYRPSLTEAGRVLLPRARRIAEEVATFRLQARGIAGGVEPELSIVVDSMFPMQTILPELKAFRDQYPTVQLRIFVESLGGVVRPIEDGSCAFGIVSDFSIRTQPFKRMPLRAVDLVFVASPDHPLARIKGPIPSEPLRDYIQLVLTDSSKLTGTRDYGVFSAQTWRLGDLGAKHVMLRAGLGYGSMPLHMVENDLHAGRLVPLTLADDPGPTSSSLPMSAAWRSEQIVGPAMQWLLDQMAVAEDGPPA